MPPHNDPPSSILILGSGVFGLSTAYYLAQSSHYSGTSITVLDRHPFPAPDGSSIDSSRIIRPDYADPDYSQLAAQAQDLWRGEFGAEGRYTECGLAIFNGLGDAGADGVDGNSVRAKDGEGGIEDEQGAGEKDMQSGLRNVIDRLGLRVGRREDGGQVTPFEDEASARAVLGPAMEGLAGTRGYVNWTSGWAHAEDGMRYLRKKVEDTGRVKFRVAEVERLLFSGEDDNDDKEARNDVRGAKIVGSGEEIRADITILATGAWTPRLIDLRGVASATGQAMAYCEISADEEERLSKNPVIICKETGMFIIPPRDGVLKIARHGYGYANPTTIPHPEDPTQTITISLPVTKTTERDPCLIVPSEGRQACRAFLQKCIPSLANRPFTRSRICWYTDTPSGDWLITYHPRYPSLLIATGGSGHAYKFVPVLGDRIVDIMRGVDRDDLGRELREKWMWPREKYTGGEHVLTEDWRGGRNGMILEEEYKKS